MDKKEIIDQIGEALKQTPKKKFKQSAEISVNFKDINMEHPDSKLNLSIILPKGRNKDLNIGVFADGDMNVRAKKLSDFVLNKEELEEYAKNKREMRKFANSCYAFIAQPDFMPIVGKSWGIVLGPRSKMPQPFPPNADLTGIFDKLKNTVRIKSKKNPTVNVPVGTEDMTPEDLAENVMSVLTGIERQIPVEKIKSVHFKLSMGPSIKLV